MVLLCIGIVDAEVNLRVVLVAAVVEFTATDCLYLRIKLRNRLQISAEIPVLIVDPRRQAVLREFIKARPEACVRFAGFDLRSRP